MKTNEKSQKPYAVYVVEGEGDKAYYSPRDGTELPSRSNIFAGSDKGSQQEAAPRFKRQPSWNLVIICQ
jgi:hypothetical protein